jgi:cytochrome c
MRRAAILMLVALLPRTPSWADEPTQRLNIGRVITEADAQKLGASILPDGTGLPEGRGTATQGDAIYTSKCSVCHGPHGEGRADFPALVGGRGSLASDKPLLTVGSYWPRATTIFDYIRRAMPYTAPGSLTADETYALTAWILSENHIIKRTDVIDHRFLHKVEMPNANGFITDPIACTTGCVQHRAEGTE